MNIAVIFAGGVGSRMHSKDRPKQFLEMYNKTIIIHTLEHFEKHSMIDAIVMVCIKDWIPYLNELLYKFRIEKVKKVVSGGETGQLSIYNGLKAAKEVAGEKNQLCLSTIEYSCAMKSHFRKTGNQQSGSGNYLFCYASLLAECFV